MPPKPKAKPRPVARRGAGAATSSTSTPAPDAVSTPAQSSEPAINDASESTSMANADSAPPAPQETTAIAPPKGRLDSLSSSSRSGSASAAPRPALKFKPKVVARKSKEERLALESKFAEAQPSSSVEPSSTRGRGSSSRGPRGRGRGGRGGFSDRFKDPAPSTASGPFALGSVISTGAQKVMAERGHRFQSSSGHQSSGFKFRQKHLRRIKSDPNGTGADDVKSEDESSSDESGTEKVDVEFISLLDEESQDEDGDQRMDADHWGAGAPVRIPRREHVDRQAMVNTDSSTKKNKAAQAQEKANEMTFETEIKIKDEPEDEDIAMADIPSASSPETKKKVRLSQSPEARRKHSSTGSPIMKRRRSSSHKKKPVISTTEEKEEFERGEEDRLTMLRELGGALPEIKSDNDADNDDPAAEDQPPPVNRNGETENEIFFFQFPTLLPELEPLPTADESASTAASSGSITADGNSDIKPETDSKDTNDSAPVPSKKAPPPHSKAALKAALARLTAPPPSGHIGQLRVHRSGRITLLYGHGPDAFEMEVNRGAHCEFLQEVVVMKEESPYGEDDKDEKGKRRGVAYSLGQVKGKYVVNPDFEKLIEATATAGGRRRERRKSEAKVKMERRGSSAKGKGRMREEAIMV